MSNITITEKTILGKPAIIKNGFLSSPDGQTFKVFMPRKKIAGLGGRVDMIDIVNHVADLFQQGNNGESVAAMCGFKDSDVIGKYKKIAVAFGLNEIDLTRKEIDTENPEYKDADFEKFMDVTEYYHDKENKTMREFYQLIYDTYILNPKKAGDKFGAARKAQKACRGVFQFCKRLNRTPRQLVNPALYQKKGYQEWKKYFKAMLLTTDTTDGKNCKEFIQTQHITSTHKGGYGAYYNCVKWLRQFIPFCSVPLTKGDQELIGWLSGEVVKTHGERASWRLSREQITEFAKYCFGDKNSIKFPYPDLANKDDILAGICTAYCSLGLRKGEGFANLMQASKFGAWTIETDPADNTESISCNVLSHKKKGSTRSSSMTIEKIAYDGNDYILKKAREYIKKRIANKEFCLIGQKNQFVKPASQAEQKEGTFHHYDALTFRGRDNATQKVYANIRAIFDRMGLPDDRSENPLHALRHFADQFWLEITDYDYDLVAEIMGYEHDGIVNSTELRKSYGKPPSYRKERKIKKLLSGLGSD